MIRVVIKISHDDDGNEMKTEANFSEIILCVGTTYNRV